MKTPRIIGISGRIRAGKDTTGHILQLLDAKLPYRVDIALENYQFETLSKWKIKKFAGKLKEIGGILTGVSPALFEDQEFKNSSMGPLWNNMTYRTFLQRLGTEAVRMNIHTNAWVNATMSDFTDADHWLVTDVRFPNEAQAIKDAGGIVIRVQRDSQENEDVSGLHESETALDDWNFDHIIRNYGTLQDLEQQVKLLATKYDLL